MLDTLSQSAKYGQKKMFIHLQGNSLFKSPLLFFTCGIFIFCVDHDAATPVAIQQVEKVSIQISQLDRESVKDPWHCLHKVGTSRFPIVDERATILHWTDKCRIEDRR